ncbi:MAG: FAD-dependent monooxygenase [Paracoccaceae bacterium]
MALADMKIAVVGAGIGGVAVAVALARRGNSVTVFEQAPELTEVGAGLQISANGMVVLRALGIVGDVPPLAVRSNGTQICDFHRGRRVLKVAPPNAGATWYFHRADLLDLLVRSAKQAGVSFTLDCSIEDVAPGTGLVQTNGGLESSFDLVIAADGGHSRARRILNPTGKATFTRQVAWRSVIPWDRAGEAATAMLSMGPRRHVVTYPLREGSEMNIVAVEERQDWTEEGWRQEGDPDDLRDRFSDFGGDVRTALAKVKKAHLWALYLHPVAERWHDGRMALLGDAAHPTLPFMAQGACMALEDAWAISACLDRHQSVEEALAQYQRLRHGRASHIVATAAGNARKFHLAPPMNWLAQGALKTLGRLIVPRYDWIYDYDVTQI